MRVRNRPLQPSMLAVCGEWAVLVDEVLPIAVEVQLPAGPVGRVHTWDLSAEHRGRPTVNDVELTGAEILIASPAAGGVVRIDRLTGAATTVLFPVDIEMVLTDGQVAWVVGESGLDEGEVDNEIVHPVVWEVAAPEEIERARQQVAGFAVASNDGWVSMADAMDPPSLAWWQENDNEDEEAEFSSVWRLEGDKPVLVPCLGEIRAAAACAGYLLAVVWQATDPIVKKVEPGNSLSYEKPSSVFVLDGAGMEGGQDVGAVTRGEGDIVVDGERAWLLGFVANSLVAERSAVSELDLIEARLSPSLPAPLHEPVAVVATCVIDLGWASPPSPPDRDFHSNRPQRLVRLVPIDGADAVVVPIPDIDEESARVGERSVWFLARAGAVLVGVDAETGATFEVPVSFDCTPHMPPAQPPTKLDLEAFEAGELEEFRSSVLGGWTSGRTGPPRRGRSFVESRSMRSSDAARFPRPRSWRCSPRSIARVSRSAEHGGSMTTLGIRSPWSTPTSV